MNRRISKTSILYTGPLLLLTLLSLFAIGHWGYLEAKAMLAQKLLESAWEKGNNKPWPWADIHPIARLHIPRLDISIIILDDASGEALAFGAGYVGGSAYPGALGMSVLAGHRDTHFAFLRDLTPGDRLILELNGKEQLEFRISGSVVLKEPNLRFPATLHEPVLALTTCWPFNAVLPGGSMRYVVWAKIQNSQKISLAVKL